MNDIVKFRDDKDLDINLVNDVVDPEFVPSESELNNILNEVFSVDPLTGLPKGDLAYYLAPDSNPTVKAWLENNLLRPRAKVTGSSVEGVTDDMLAEMSQRKDESLSDYTLRLRGIYDDAQKLINSNKSKNEKI